MSDDQAEPLLLAEGPETGLSVWISTGYETHIALGSMGTHEPPIDRPVIACRDDDPPQSPADKGLSRALAAWRQTGADVRVATPWPELRGDRSDFNDVLQAGGIDAVRARIEVAINPEPADGRIVRVTVTEGRAILAGKIADFFAEASVAGSSPIHAIKAEVGVGKSREVRHATAIHLARLRTAGDKRTGIFLVPTIALADEQAGLFRALPEVQAARLTATVWRGRGQPDPDHPDFNDSAIPDESKATMCRDLGAVFDAMAALADVHSSVCQRRNKDGSVKSQCEHFDLCPYQAQRNRRADLIFGAHEMLTEDKPAAFGKPAFVVIDETAWQDFLFGIGSDNKRLPIDILSRGDDVPDDTFGIATDRLAFLRRRLFDVFVALSDGPIPRAAIAATGITTSSASEARALEWRRKLDADIFPGMPPAARKRATDAVAANKTIARLSLFWQAIGALMHDDGPAASGWVELAVHKTKDGIVRVVELKGRKTIDKAFDVPTLILDATLRVEPLRYFWPSLKTTADIAVQAPCQRVIQVQDRSYSKNHLRRISAFRDVRAILFRLAREYTPGRVLCVIQLEFEEQLVKAGNLPDNLDLAHHNAVAGKDGWRDVVALVAIGRTAPSPQSMEQLTEALSGAAMPRSTTWYPQADVTREMADGSYRTAQSDQHAHPLAEACRWSVAESEVAQIIGRARGCNRTQTNPVDVWVLNSMPLRVPVHRLIGASDLTASPGELMAAEGGVEFANATDAAAAYPTLWSSREAAKKAMERHEETRLGTSPYKRLLIRECPQPPPDERPGMVRAIYQLVGAGKKPAVAWFDLALVPDPAAWLTDRLGKLSRFEVVRPTANLPELTAMSEMATATDDEKLARRANLRPAPPEYHHGCVPLVPDGYGDLLDLFPGVKPVDNGNITDILTITSNTGTALVMTSGVVIIMTANQPPRFNW